MQIKPTKEFVMPYYKFIKPDIVNLKRWIDGKILFSKIPDLNDDSEKCATVMNKNTGL
jgi:hypothetical protein